MNTYLQIEVLPEYSCPTASLATANAVAFLNIGFSAAQNNRAIEKRSPGASWEM
jgi:hypothetical protein